jgi:hypothetical protein
VGDEKRKPDQLLMKKTMSLKQLDANRRNAQKSTGPKNPDGRAVSKMNALKHGLLAQTVVVRGHQIKESSNKFKKLCQEFYADLNPVGPLEEMLVDKIVSLTWRLRRVHTAESGEIALSVDGGWWKRENHNPLRMMLNMPPIPIEDPLVTQLERSVKGCHYLHYCLRKVREGVERDGELTEAALKDFKWGLRDQPDAMVRKLDGFRAWLAANPEKLEPEVLRARHKEDVSKYLDQQIRDMGFQMDRHEEREDAEERAHQSAAVLPSPEVLDKILRYEAALERQLFRAINQLERLQRRRLGENISAPLTMEVSERH